MAKDDKDFIKKKDHDKYLNPEPKRDKYITLV